MSVFRTVHIVRVFIYNNILFCTVELLVLVQLLIQRRSRKKRPRVIQYILGELQVPGGEKIEREGRKRFIFSRQVCVKCWGGNVLYINRSELLVGKERFTPNMPSFSISFKGLRTVFSLSVS